MKRKTGLLIVIIIAAFLIVFSAGFLAYTGVYYHADAQSVAALVSDEQVAVLQTFYGWYFDGPSEDRALVFYPGAKVEETAYAPFLHSLAAEGIDVCLVKTPFRLAILGINSAESVIKQHEYSHWYIGGHSMGGAAAAIYAANHGEQVEGLVLCAAFPTKAIQEDMKVVSLYGSEDHVIDLSSTEKGRSLVSSSNYVEYVINGGNHAQFGNYGAQRGDGQASLSAQDQQMEAIEVILKEILR